MTNVAETPSGNTQVILIACESLISPFYHAIYYVLAQSLENVLADTKWGVVKFQTITLKKLLFDGIISNSLHNHSDTQV